jgi:hypothetical protein
LRQFIRNTEDSESVGVACVHATGTMPVSAVARY